MSLPVLHNVLLRTDGGKVVVTGSDTTVYASTRVAVQHGKYEPGGTTVDATQLQRAIGGLKDSPSVSLFTNEDDCGITIAAGSRKYSITGIPAEEYPTIPIAAGEHGKSYVRTAEFKRVVESVMWSASTSVTMQAMNGILFADGKYVVATNTHTLVVADMNCGGVDDALVPAYALKVAMKSLAGDGFTTLMRELDWASFDDGTRLITARVMDVEFPNWKRVIPDETTTEVAFRPPDGLKDFCRTIDRLGGNKVVLQVNGDPGVLQASFDNFEGLTGSESFDLNVSDWSTDVGDFAIAFHPKYVVDCLVAAERCGKSVALHIRDSLSPAVFKKCGWTCVLMPMQLA